MGKLTKKQEAIVLNRLTRGGVNFGVKDPTPIKLNSIDAIERLKLDDEVDKLSMLDTLNRRLN